MIVRTDDEVVFSSGSLPIVLDEIGERANLTAVVVTGNGQDRNADAREFITHRNRALPKGIDRRVIEPAVEERVGPAVDPVQIGIGASGGVPAAEEPVPMRIIIIKSIVYRLLRCGVQRPRVSLVQ